MKKRILTQVITAAAALALPLSVSAQDFGSQTGAGNLNEGASTSGSGNPGTGSYSSGGTFSGDAAPAPEKKSGEFVGGIVVHDGTAYVVHKLQNEMALPDGSKVRPDGTVIESDGSMRSIGAGQALTMDGQVIGAPFTPGSNMESPVQNPQGIYNSPNAPGATTGIGESGEKMEPQGTSEPSMPNDISAQDSAPQPDTSSGSVGTEPREF